MILKHIGIGNGRRVRTWWMCVTRQAIMPRGTMGGLVKTMSPNKFRCGNQEDMMWQWLLLLSLVHPLHMWGNAPSGARQALQLMFFQRTQCSNSCIRSQKQIRTDSCFTMTAAFKFRCLHHSLSGAQSCASAASPELLDPCDAQLFLFDDVSCTESYTHSGARPAKRTYTCSTALTTTGAKGQQIVATFYRQSRCTGHE